MSTESSRGSRGSLWARRAGGGRSRLVRALPARAVCTAGVVFALSTTGCRSDATSPSMADAPLLPRPLQVVPASGTFVLRRDARFAVPSGSQAWLDEAGRFAADLRVSTGFAIPVVNEPPRRGDVAWTVDPAFGPEQYELTVGASGIVVRAGDEAGAFLASRTLLQFVDPAFAAHAPTAARFEVPAGTVTDAPRFAYRGVMLDVARHFFTVEEVERLTERAAAYKVNHLHLHLSDDQGFRIAISAYPALTDVGGATEAGGGVGGYYTAADFARIVATAARHHVVVVPEIDVPGHSNAMLASVASLNCDGMTTAPYTGTNVGFSSVCTSSAAALAVVRDVFTAVASLSPGPYLHMGGDESAATPAAEYAPFVEAVQAHIVSLGKIPIGWDEIAKTNLEPTALVQYWFHADRVADALAQGNRVILSPARHAYLDMRYDAETPSGQAYVGFVDVDRAYVWDPSTLLAGLDEASVFGVEGALWTEYFADEADVERMVFPRLLGLAEIGWTRGARDFDDYARRLALHGPRMEAMGIGFYRSTFVAWP